MRAGLEGLKRLSGAIDVGQAEFGAQTDGLEKKLGEDVRAFGGFAGQEGSIEGLVGKMEKDKARKEEVLGRLEKVRGRIEDWEVREKERKAVRRRRLGLAMTILGIIAVVVVVIVVWRSVMGQRHVRIFGGRAEAEERRNQSLGINLAAESGLKREHEEKEQQWKHVLDEL